MLKSKITCPVPALPSQEVTQESLTEQALISQYKLQTIKTFDYPTQTKYCRLWIYVTAIME